MTKLLDLDKSLSQQPGGVKSALGIVGPTVKPPFAGMPSDTPVWQLLEGLHGKLGARAIQSKLAASGVHGYHWADPPPTTLTDVEIARRRRVLDETH